MLSSYQVNNQTLHHHLLPISAPTAPNTAPHRNTTNIPHEAFILHKLLIQEGQRNFIYSSKHVFSTYLPECLYYIGTGHRD